MGGYQCGISVTSQGTDLHSLRLDTVQQCEKGYIVCIMVNKCICHREEIMLFINLYINFKTFKTFSRPDIEEIGRAHV